MASSVDHRLTAVLGIVTICAYGSWYYSFGVLLDPIRVDTGWRESTLAASFSLGTLVTGVGSLLGGRLLDRVGHRFVFAIAGVVTGLALWSASAATDVWLFVVAAAIGQGTLGALGFYHITMTTVVRLHPGSAARAIAVLTLWGAFASAIYLPLAAWSVDQIGWRSTVQVLAVTASAAFIIAAIALPSAPVEEGLERSPLRQVIRLAVAPGAARWFAIAVSCGGIAMSTMLVYQVPTMTSLGLSATSAATFAGVRGFAQLGGRLPLGMLLERFGVDRSLQLAFAALGVGGALLAVADDQPTALAFAIVAGVGTGAFSPLQGIKSQEIFAADSLGATMGFYGALMMVVGAAGPAVAGTVADLTGDRRWVSFVVIVAALGAVRSVMLMRRASRVPRGVPAT